MRHIDRQPAPLTELEIAEVIDTLRAQACAEQSLQGLVEAWKTKGALQSGRSLEQKQIDMIHLAKTLYAARRITRDELAHLLCLALEGLNEARLMNGEFKAELDPIEARIAANDAWEAVVDRHFGELLEAYGFEEPTELWRSERTEWDRIVEVGRRLFREKTRPTSTETVNMLVVNFEREAALCEQVGAYYAGCAMLGAAAEARLLGACLEAPAAAESARQALSPQTKPRKSDPHTWTLEHLIAIATEARWIGHFEDEDFIFLVDGLANRLRHSRNFLHPGRHALDRPLSAFSQDEFRDAKAAYHSLRLALESTATSAPRDVSAGPAEGPDDGVDDQLPRLSP